MPDSTSEGERPLQHNEEPIAVVKLLRCRGCGKRAPWCSCGSADYYDPDEDKVRVKRDDGSTALVRRRPPEQSDEAPADGAR